MSSVVERDSYQADFEQLETSRPNDPAWLRTLRRQGFERFTALGFPTTRQEEWKFTSVAPIAETRFALAGPAHADGTWASDASLGSDTIELVFVNGHYRADLSRPHSAGGVTVSTLGQLGGRQPLIERHMGSFGPDAHPFVALNTAFVEDVAVVIVAPHAVVETPIHLLFLSAPGGRPTVSHPRIFVHAGESSQSRIAETYAGPGDAAYFTNLVSEVVLAPNAVVDHYKIQREGVKAYHMGSLHMRGDRSSTFSSHSIAIGGAIVRNDVVTILGGEGIDCTLNGLYVADGRSLVDNHTTVDHALPHCDSHEVYKGILGGHARAVFNGKIIVRPDAQKTDAKQTNKALLLSDNATINTKPQLEIFANDVKCTHGAAIGQLDEDAVFYLRTRGLDLEAARDLLIHAFAGDVVNRIRIAALRERVERALTAAIPAH
jgi:Fe-S cluster assembly protein SufD